MARVDVFAGERVALSPWGSEELFRAKAYGRYAAILC